ncbi:hypothetical protein [Trichlorobacter lovleyi]|jgi:hypothetical protein|uniref:Uncharacterized protein n=1 Tax=Trichlorobacter lovleyi (strain ATCC BAA-1151 / DSM 17278 / SZ) TaxID=398767 RepID=B3E9U8_TRIL1|nr:hypothetical protein [Trichlorobacter lovleyi]ACD96823.1 hypothetical protein Glov_3117 [Trichlorobacter lovleyi SZ]
MTTVEWLDHILPSDGIYCVAQLDGAAGKLKHYWYTDKQQAADKLLELDAAGYNSYIAQASFKSSESRKADNALLAGR